MYIACVFFSKQFCFWCLDHKWYDKCGYNGVSLCSPESYPTLFQHYLYYLVNYTLHCSGGSRGGALGLGLPPYFKTKLRPKGRKNIFWRPAPHFSKGLDDPHPPTPHYLKVWSQHCTAHADYVIYLQSTTCNFK